MKVIATKAGYHIGPRKPGDVFEMDESRMKKKDGKTVLPSWVEEHKAPQPAPAAKGKSDPLV